MLTLIRLFAEDARVKILLILIASDFFFGIFAAIKRGEFRLSYVASFLRDDILGKVCPYFVLWAILFFAGDVEIPGLDIGGIESLAFAITAGAMAGSVMSSFKDLGWLPRLPESLAGPEREEMEVVGVKPKRKAPAK